MASQPFADTVLQTLFHTYSLEPAADQLQLASDIRVALLGVSAQIWWRFQIPFGTWPYSLLKLTDPSLPKSEKARTAFELLEGHHRCCLDVCCSQKLRAKYSSAQEFLDDQDLMNLLTSWAVHGKVCSMHVERLFALIRQSVPDSSPSAERICSGGFLSQVLKQHRHAGGVAPGTFQRKDAIALGVPIRSNVQEACSQPKRARGHLTFINKQIREESAELARSGGRMTRAQASARRRELGAEFRALSADEQKSLTDEAVAEATLHASRVSEEAALAEGGQYKADELWNIGVRSSPLCPDLARRLVQEKLGDDGPVHGLQKGLNQQAPPALALQPC